MKKITVLSIFGTRPEAIKMAPLVKALEKEEKINSKLLITAQHREMLDQVLDIFDLKVDYDLNIMSKGQTLTDITNRAMKGVEEVLISLKPDIVLVHGDTTTTFSASLASFYNKVSVGHVEAGLRTYDKMSPYPEEMNRSLVGKIADIHFCPTINNKNNLINENITKDILVTGNTVIDALKYTVKDDYIFKNEVLRNQDFNNKRHILLTAHRRENLGEPLENIFRAVKRVKSKYDDVIINFPVHLNPKVKDVAHEILGGIDGINLISPLDVEDMHNLMAKSYLILTDSGGLQEEAPSLGKPVFVLRKETERPEAVEAGTVKVIGVDEEDVFLNTVDILDNESVYLKMSKATNPYGDGFASERIVKGIIDKVK